MLRLVPCKNQTFLVYGLAHIVTDIPRCHGSHANGRPLFLVSEDSMFYLKIQKYQYFATAQNFL